MRFHLDLCEIAALLCVQALGIVDSHHLTDVGHGLEQSFEVAGQPNAPASGTAAVKLQDNEMAIEFGIRPFHLPILAKV